LLNAAKSNGPEVDRGIRALANDPAQKRPEADALIKQVYFPLGEGAYHLLIPLYPSSLTNEVMSIARKDGVVQKDNAKAREANAKAKDAAKKVPLKSYRKWPDRCAIKFGGANYQNVTNLLCGRFYLLPSLPPIPSRSIRPPQKDSSVFRGWTLANYSREVLNNLVQYRKGNGAPHNAITRRKQSTLLTQVCDKVLEYAEQVESSAPHGWAAKSYLAECERTWLDPKYRNAQSDWKVEVAERFADWLNYRLSSENSDDHSTWNNAFMTALEKYYA
jgi:CRISPR-associated protein Csy1